MGLNPDEFLRAVLDFPGTFRRMLGPVAALAGRAAECGRGWMHGVRRAARLFR